MELPYRAEYSKSGRAKCKGCKQPIDQGILRLAVLTQSPFFDGKQANWYHFDCFFKKQKVRTTDDIEHFESLRIADQDRIRENVDGSSVVLPEPKGKKRAADAPDKNKKMILKEYVIEYAKSGRAVCKGCLQKIMKGDIRISKKDFDSDIGRQVGGADQWHHVACFAQLRSELGYFASGDQLPGFKSLKRPDQADVMEALTKIKQEEIPETKKVKLEDDSNEKEYREQNKVMFDYRDKLQAVQGSELIELFEHNSQAAPSGIEEMYDRLSDIMTFGALKRCKECKDGQLVFSKLGYVCEGHLSEWARCSNVTKDPVRTKFVVPKHLKEYGFLKKYKYVARKRIIKEANPTVVVKKEVKDETDGKPRTVKVAPAFYDMVFVILGKPARGKDFLKKQIESLGGKVVTKISNNIMAVIADKEMVEKHGARISEAETEQVQVVPEDFVDEAKDNVGKIPDLIIKKSICTWGSDPTTRLPAEPSSSNKSHSRYTSRVPSKVTLKLKGGSAVDPDSGLQDRAQVYEDQNKEKYTVVLGLTDVQNNKNSFYKLQILKSDTSEKFWVFRGWGRIGTTIGGNKTDEMNSSWEAKKAFCEFYEQKSGNCWEDRHNFVKVPGKMYPIDVDYGIDDTGDLDIVDSDSKLPKPVQDLIRLIFDVNQMKKLMLEFELDTEKMPLGKLSKKQIEEAFKVLSELQDLVEKGTTEQKLIEATNRFYTLIPHSFGVQEVTILRDKEIIKQKLDMLDSLLEIQIGYSLMQSSEGKHTVDAYYNQLKTEIDVLHKESEEFKIIQEYVKNTHAATHASYELELEDVYIIKREGEDKRFKPFKKLHNRKLLWHGSRTSNYAGILSQGLRIAPPEAPVTGYMFGKGIYFADMVSKSANYCCTNSYNSTGLLLLCEVALGNMYERPHADCIIKPPKGKHSVKGVGRTHPDPSLVKKIDDVEVPLGTGVSAPGTESNSLLYNEYIVYDVAQVRMKYLLKTSFKYKY